MYSDVAIIIPSRLGSERLFQKPLKLIGNYTMIEHMVRQVKKTEVENIFVATDSELIAEKVVESGGRYIMTSPNCLSGTDRVYEAVQALSNDRIEYVINVQGDMPFIEPEAILSVIGKLKNSNFGIVTPVTKVDINLAQSESNVKVVVDNQSRALYFSRSPIPHFAKEFLYHIGVYGFRKNYLESFMKLPQSFLEKNENLEQLRAIENNMDIGICYVEDVPISVDTSEDLNKAIEFYNMHFTK